MKSLKPIETKDFALTKKSAAELQEEITRLQNSIVGLQNEIAEIQNELDVETVGRGSPTFENIKANSVDVTNAVNADSVAANSINSTAINSEDAEFLNATVTNVLDAAHVNTPDLDAEVGSINELESDNISTDILTADAATVTELGTTTATIATANIATANIATYNTAKVDATEIETPLIKATEAVLDAAAIANAEVEEAVINNAEIGYLYNRNRYFQNDNNVMQLTGVEELHPGYIMIDTKGVQTTKIRAVDDNGELFTVIYSNARATPLIQWTKRNDNAIQRIFYQYKTNKLYIETWESCQFQWQIDAFESSILNPPQTYQDTFPESLLDCYRYNCTRKSGMVLMGDDEDGVVLSVQGTIEGNFLVDSGEFTYVNFYSDSAYDLFKVAKAFFRSGSDIDGWKYEKAEVFGYIKHTDTVTPAHDEYDPQPMDSSILTEGSTEHVGVVNYTHYSYSGPTLYAKNSNDEYVEIAEFQWRYPDGYAFNVRAAVDADGNVIDSTTDTPWSALTVYTVTHVPAGQSPYRDEDNTEIEALEKIEYVDENTIVLTIDNKYGQDELTITGSEIEEDEKLPFVLGFTVRTPRIDKVFNEDSEPFPGAKADNYYYGD